VGGHCIPLYPYFVSHLEEAELIRTARTRNESMPKFLAQLTIEELQRIKVPLKENRVVLMGIAFRAGVKEDRNSPFHTVLSELSRRGIQAYAWDPFYSDDEIMKLKALPIRTLKGMDAAVVITDHKEYRELDWPQAAQEMRHPIIVDGRFIVPVELRNKGVRVIRLDGK